MNNAMFLEETGNDVPLAGLQFFLVSLAELYTSRSVKLLYKPSSPRIVAQTWQKFQPSRVPQRYNRRYLAAQSPSRTFSKKSAFRRV